MIINIEKFFSDANAADASRTDDVSPQSFRELASYLGVSAKNLAFVLYKIDRASSYYRMELPKSNGKIRTIDAVRGRLKTFQRIALDHLARDFKPSAYAHGFIKHRSIFTNAYIHKRRKRIIRVDIKDFFPSIHFGRVQGMFTGAPFGFGKEAATALAQLACLDVPDSRLPQGGVLSPYIANMICRRLDSRLAGLAKTWNCDFTRYADDIYFSTNDLKRFDSERLVNQISTLITEEGFEVNQEKTQVLSPRQRQIVTGVVVNDGLNINRRYYRSLRATIHNCEKYGIKSQVVKPGGFKDERTSRPPIQVEPDGTLTCGSRQIDQQEAELIFMRHLLGRITFLLQATSFAPPPEAGYWKNESAESIKAAQEKLRTELRVKPRSLAAQKLLLRFNRLTAKKSHLEEVMQASRKQLNRHSNIKEDFVESEARGNAKKQALREARKNPDVKQRQTELSDAKSRTQLVQLLGSWVISDARYSTVDASITEPDALRAAILQVAMYPKINPESNHNLLRSLIDSENGLGAITHSNELTTHQVHSLLEQHVAPSYYEISFGLKKMFDEFDRLIDGIAAEIGPSKPINWLEHPKTSEFIRAMKRTTRFGRKSEDSTRLDDVLKQTVASVDRRLRLRGLDVKFDIQSTKRLSFYTHVPSAQKAFDAALESCAKNTSSEIVYISTEQNKDPITTRVVVGTKSGDIVEHAPNRSFAHGKINNAARNMNGLAEYYFEAEFIDGNYYRINMLNGDVEELEGESKELRHVFVFPEISCE